MGATMKDIARVTGLGLATISSYLNGGNVREKNRIKIEAAIDELDFEVNEVARGLKTNRTKTIGIIIPELNNIFCAEIITEVEDVLRNHGYATMICDCRTDAATGSGSGRVFVSTQGGRTDLDAVRQIRKASGEIFTCGKTSCADRS